MLSLRSVSQTSVPDPAAVPSVSAWTVEDGLWLGGALIVAATAAALVHWLLFRGLDRLVERTPWTIGRILARRLRRPAFVVLLLLGIQVAIHGAMPPALRAAELLRQVSSLASIGVITWLAVAAISIVKDHFKGRWRMDVEDNLAARRIHTQVDVLARTLAIFAIVIGTGAALTTFPRVRELGTSLLASAGIAGIAAGIAARPLLENLIAGVQIAITQPLRLDDVVVIDGEQGRVEAINATYVVLRLWDERRLVVPFSRVIQQPFQNWSLTSSRIVGTIVLPAPWTVSISAARAELERIVEGSSDWDRRRCVLQVSNATDATIELRALVSAADAERLASLRNHVREKLVEYLQRARQS